MTLNELKIAILEDGVIDADEVVQLRDVLYADGVIDREEADILFDLNDAVSGKENSPDWGAFFTEALTNHVLADETSPGVLDEDESNYIISKVQADGTIDPIEKALVKNIMAEAQSVPDTFRAFAESI